MGTNYYVATNKCDCCKRYDEQYHIGKSSHGWAFTFQGYPHDKLTSWKLWKSFLEDQSIIDEYGDTIDYDDFCNMIETVKAPGYIREDGHKNLTHNGQGKTDERPWFNVEYDWDDEDGYSFSKRDFS